MSVDAHWESAYAAGDATVSWKQDDPTRSLACIRSLRLDPSAPIVDVGGGSSRLAGALVADGHTDVTVVDLSRAALELARERLTDRGSAVRWVVADLRAWRPGRSYAVWHDRAVLHFLVDSEDRLRYVQTLRDVLAPGGHAIIATFAPDGPERCSDLPVQRSGPDELFELLGDEFAPVSAAREKHRTPSGRSQAFSWIVARREPDARDRRG